MNICFVILHYQNVDVTKKCIQCLQHLNDYQECDVVLVDNASPNCSGKRLKEIYKKKSNIHVILNKENLGFAKGNNIGYKYAKEQLKAELIIVMNNDVLIKQIDFIRKLKKMNNEMNVQLIAPDIINLAGIHQNPFRKEPLSNKRLEYLYKYNQTINVLYKVPIINYILLTILKYRSKRKKVTLSKEEEPLFNIIPHGSCIIYLKPWVDREDFAFLPNTFMYFEEDILFEYIKMKNYIIKYLPELVVEHLEDASVNSSTTTEVRKRSFISKHLSNSVKTLIEMRNKI